MSQVTLPALRHTIKQHEPVPESLPFAIYSSIDVQDLINVPISKPLLIVVVAGSKELVAGGEFTCLAGQFVFLAPSPAISMRNVPKAKHYKALLIEFDRQDYQGMQVSQAHSTDYHVGEVSALLEKSLQQFVEISSLADKSLWASRKQELLALLGRTGHSDILKLLGEPQLKDQLHELYTERGFKDLSSSDICHRLAMSESSLRRKLQAEGTSLQAVKDSARLGLALHLLQSTSKPINVIAERCGYQSQSRFTEKFKKRFSLTPSELRKTRLTPLG